ncbi:MAG TPA: fatty acid desaturase, partial [Stellaceae bacterium]|nr:fatty acid desaturase [Stellaceae bacterium]
MGSGVLAEWIDGAAGPAGDHTDRSVDEAFSVKEAHAIVRHLLRRNPAIYFADFAVTMTVVYLAGFVYFRAGLSPLQLGAGVVCGCALFRAGMFIHEIQHMRRGEMTGFVVAWNLVYGIPMMLPSFMYANHRDHHDPRTYGTVRDGEYRVFTTGGLPQIAAHFLIGLVVPPALVLRFLVLGPLSHCWPRLRRFVLVHAMTLGDPAKGRRIWPDENHAIWAVMELAVCAVVVTGSVLLASGFLPWTILPKGYAIGVLAVELNAMRDFTAHRFGNSGEPMSHAEQLADSINIVGKGPVTYLLYPIGMRYHALHHLFPAMPYHNMARAHRLLMERLPAQSPYRATNRRGFFDTAGTMVRAAAAYSKEARLAKVT